MHLYNKKKQLSVSNGVGSRYEKPPGGGTPPPSQVRATVNTALTHEMTVIYIYIHGCSYYMLLRVLISVHGCRKCVCGGGGDGGSRPPVEKSLGNVPQEDLFFHCLY